VRSISRFDNISLAALASFTSSSVSDPACSSDVAGNVPASSINLIYGWNISIASGSTPSLFAPARGGFQLKNPAIFFITGKILPASATYIVTVTVTHKVKQTSSSASVQVFVKPSDLVLVIKGGLAQNIAIGTSLLLDSSDSYDPDSLSLFQESMVGTYLTNLPNIAYSWTCASMSPTFDASFCPLQFDKTKLNKPALSLFANSSFLPVLPASALINLHVADATKVRSSSCTVSITVIGSGLPLVSIPSQQGAKVNTNATYNLVGYVSFPSTFSQLSAKVIWTVDDDSFADIFAGVSLTPLTSSISVPPSSFSSKVFIPLLISPNSLPPRSTLTFALSCRMQSSSNTQSF
jgi:hypothetical protein